MTHLSYTQALAQSKKVGAAHAKGDAYVAMLASMVPLFCCLAAKTATTIYDWMVQQPDVRAAFKNLVQDPMMAAMIALKLSGYENA